MTFFTHLFNADRQETTGDVLLFGILEIVVICQVIFFSWKWALYIPNLEYMIAPAGIANYINISFMFSGPYSLINAGVITLFVLLGFLRKGRFFYLLALLGMHLQYAARFSQGKVSHGSAFTGMALLVFALVTIIITDRIQRRKLIKGMILFFMSVGYTSAAFCKLIASGPQWVNGRHLILWIQESWTDLLSQHGYFGLNGIQQLIINHPTAATLLLTFGLLTELCGFLLCLRKTRWVEATLLIGMHVGIMVTMNIDFTYYLTFLVILGYPWARLFDYYFQKDDRLTATMKQLT